MMGNACGQDNRALGSNMENPIFDNDNQVITQILMDLNADEVMFLKYFSQQKAEQMKNSHLVLSQFPSDLSEIYRLLKHVDGSQNCISDQHRLLEQKYQFLLRFSDHVSQAIFHMKEQLAEMKLQYEDYRTKPYTRQEITEFLQPIIEEIKKSSNQTELDLNIKKLQSCMFQSGKNIYFVAPEQKANKAQMNTTTMMQIMRTIFETLNTTMNLLSKIHKEMFKIPRFQDFDQNLKEIQKNGLFADTLMESAFIQKEQVEFLHKILENHSQYREPRSKLLYRASRDGFQDFHRYCDNKIKTVVVCQSDNNLVFGGYYNGQWTNKLSSLYDQNNQSFLFSASKRQVLPIIKNGKLAAYGNPNTGPQFGQGVDLFISNQNDPGSHYSNLGGSYELPKGIQFESHESQSYLAGDHQFKLIDYQVYQIQ